MATSIKALKKQADNFGMTVSELVAELEAGCNPNKPYRFAIGFHRLEDLKWFMRHIVTAYEAVHDEEVGIFRATVMDPEYGGQPQGNAFVMRPMNDPYVIGERLEL